MGENVALSSDECTDAALKASGVKKQDLENCIIKSFNDNPNFNKMLDENTLLLK